MDAILQRIAVARRRMNTERFLSLLFRSWCAWLVVAVLGIVTSKIWPVPVEAQTWTLSWLSGSLAAGFLTAIVWSWLTRKGELEAAIEIDKRFGLKERVSSAVGLDAEMRETPAGQALLSDAVKRIERLDVGERFRLKVDRSAWWPLVPGMLAVLIAFFVSSRVPENPVEAKTTTSPQQIKKATQALQKKAEQQRKESEKKKLSEATESLLKKLEEGSKELSNQASPDKQKTLVKLNDLSKELERRKKTLGLDDKFKQQLNNLKDLKKGPAEAAAQAMKNGDFRKAMQEIENLKKKMADNKLNEEEKKQLAEQLNQMKDVMQKAVEAHEQAKKEVAEEVEKARKAGDTEQAQKLQKQLDKMEQQKPAMQKLEQLAQECKNCANAMKNGNAQQAQQAMDKLAKDLAAMAQSQDEMQMLDEALEQIADAKQMMSGAMNQLGEDEGDLGDGDMQNFQNQRNQPGRGMGAGRGQGERPEQRNKTGFYDSKVNPNIGKGAAAVVDLVDGPNKKGTVTEEIKQSFEAAKQSGDDPLTGQRLPRDYRDHAKEYFEAFRKGQQ